MANNLKIQGNFLVITNTVDPFQEFVRVSRSQVDFKRDSDDDYKFFYKESTKVGSDNEQYLLGGETNEFAFADFIDDRTGSAFTDSDELDLFLSLNIGFFFDGITKEFLIEVQKGNVLGHSIVNVAARNDDVDTALVDLNILDLNHAWLTTASTLEAISDDANDTAAGSGARTILVEGLDPSFDQISEEITMNGLTVTTATTATFIRINDVHVVDSGTYGGTASPSHAGNITVRLSGGGTDQVQISNSPVSTGVAEHGRYTIPNGYTGIVISGHAQIDSTKTCSVFVFKREGADVTSAPFTDAHQIITFPNATGEISLVKEQSLSPLVEKTDIWSSAIAGANNSKVELNINILLIDNNYI